MNLETKNYAEGQTLKRKNNIWRKKGGILDGVVARSWSKVQSFLPHKA